MKYALKVLVLITLTFVQALTPLSAHDGGNADDLLEIGLLTCTPGTEVYELYGHTAIRVRNHATGTDIVFNYGVFDFRTPHFAWRFMLGETDYTISAVPFSHFAALYALDGRSVDEQVIDLTPTEAARIEKTLVQQATTKGWTYRYNFLYDNCTTRAVQLIVDNIEGRIVWPKAAGEQTFRGIIHEYATPIAPWSTFGQDLILGAEMDATIGREQQMFAPLYAERYFDNAFIIDKDGHRRPLVKAKSTVAEAIGTAQEATTWPSPLAVALLLLLATVGIGIAEWRKSIVCHAVDDLILLLQGGTGCIVALLFFFSAHPAVGSNWLIFILNPLPLCYLPYKVICNMKKRNDLYTPLLSAEIGLLVLIFIISPQSFPLGIYALALILLIRGITLLHHQRWHLAASTAHAQRTI